MHRFTEVPVLVPLSDHSARIRRRHDVVQVVLLEVGVLTPALHGQDLVDVGAIRVRRGGGAQTVPLLAHLPIGVEVARDVRVRSIGIHDTLDAAAQGIVGVGVPLPGIRVNELDHAVAVVVGDRLL